MYTAIAGVYDKLMKDFDYDNYYNNIAKFISGVTLELAVGSGEFTLRYIADVPRVIALDISEDMLNIAVNKLKRYRNKIVLLNEDMSLYLPDYKVYTVLSVCDGLNYVEDLPSLFTKVYKTLNVGGKFIFDISTRYKLSTIIGNNIFYEDRENLTYIWTNNLNENSVDMELTFFTKEKEVYSRRDERHRQYMHKVKDVADWLMKVGFDVNVLDGENFEEIGAESERAIFICSK